MRQDDMDLSLEVELPYLVFQSLSPLWKRDDGEDACKDDR